VIGRDAIEPGTLARLKLASDLRYAQLDAQFTASLDLQSREILASAVIQQVGRRMGEIAAMATPISFAGSTAGDSALSTRARNALGRHKFVHGALPTTIAQLTNIPEFGAKCLLEVLPVVDFLTSEDGASGTSPDGAAPAAAGRPSRAVGRATRELCSLPWAEIVTSDDPRLGGLIQRLDGVPGSAREAVQRASASSYEPAQARRMVAAIKTLIVEGTRLRRLRIDQELLEIVKAVVEHEGARTLIVARLGLGGRPPITLDEAGRDADVTRERVRQREKQFRTQIADYEAVWTPALERGLRVAAKLSPTTFEELRQALVHRRLIPEDFSLRSVLAAADVFGLAIEVDARQELIGSSETKSTKILAVARRLVTHWGATTVEEVCAVIDGEGDELTLPRLARLVLETQDEFCWLDQVRGWFWLRGTSRNRLLNQIEKIVAVAGSLSIGDLRDGVGRHHRMKGFRPPREVLALLCEESGLYERRGDLILGKLGLTDWKNILGQNESTLVEILLDHGPVMTREELERLAVDQAGLKRSSFYAYLSYSPIIARFAPGVYGLRGAPVTAAEVDAMIPHTARTQVLQDHGWTSSGAIWIAYRISAAGERSGVLGVPGAIKALIRGSYELTTEDDRSIGTLAVEDNMWGLSPFYRRYGIEEGDYVVLVIDLQARIATIYAGAQELLLRFQAGE
jgi:hypothetical protein